MTILVASILTKTGSILLSRQFTDISKNTLEQYLNSFLCCLNSDSQHTFIDGEYVRYVYQPMGLLYMVLMTSLNSNIFEDLETLRMLSRIVSHYCYPVNEDTVRSKTLTLVFAFDEMVSLGYREDVSLNDVAASIDMHSENEILAEIVKKDRENQAKETMKRKAKEFEMIQKLQRQQERLSHRGPHGGLFNSPLASLASNIFNNLKGSHPTNPSYNFTSSSNDFIMVSEVSQKSSKLLNSNHTASMSNSNFAKSVKSLQLKKNVQPAAVLENERMRSSLLAPISKTATVEPSQKSDLLVRDSKILVKLNETVSTVINRNGQLEKYEVTGVMTVNVTQNEFSNVKFQLSTKPNPKLTTQTHPNIDKKQFLEHSLIAIKEGGRKFPLNNDIGVLKWRYQSNNIDDLMLQMNCWVDITSESSLNVIVDLELNDTSFTLENVVVCFPIDPNFHPTPRIINISEGQYSFDKNSFTWQLPILDSNNKNASIELSLDSYSAPVDSIYPIKCMFNSHSLLLQSQIESFMNENGELLDSNDYVIQSSLSTKTYDIV